MWAYSKETKGLLIGTQRKKTISYWLYMPKTLPTPDLNDAIMCGYGLCFPSERLHQTKKMYLIIQSTGLVISIINIWEESVYNKHYNPPCTSTGLSYWLLKFD